VLVSSCEVYETSLVCLKDSAALFCLLRRVWDDRVLDVFRCLLFVVPNHPSAEVIDESHSPAFPVDLSFYQVRIIEDVEEW
jgi:hypothetical protein